MELDFKIPFQSDEIQRHGPPLAFSEDVFEKRHGVIRAKLLHQENQLARSRDTALIFGKSYIFSISSWEGSFKQIAFGML